MAKITKKQLLELLENDKNPMETLIDVYFECTNDDKGIYGEVVGLKYDDRFKTLTILCEYEEDEY